MERDTLLGRSASASSSPDLPQYDATKIEAVGHLDVKDPHKDEPSRISIDTASSLHTSYHGPVIPPTKDHRFRRRTIVLCFDGTGNQFDLDNSNVVAFYSLLKKGDLDRQLVYYHSGIGTYTVQQIASPLGSRISKTLDLMFANDLSHHVMDGYRFLMHNYRVNDKICIFGFSRGAYTARALAGMIHKVGLLPAGNNQQVPFAYDMYKEDNELGWKQSVAFKRAFSVDVDIDFVGVWDTVASVGLLPQTLPFTKSNTAIKVFRHALSLDEHRIKFMPSLYERITQREAERGDFKLPDLHRNSYHEDEKSYPKPVEEEKLEEVSKRTSLRASSVRGPWKYTATRAFRSVRHIRRKEETIDKDTFGAKDDLLDSVEELSPDGERDRLEQMYLDRSAPTDVLEVWFAGCHCDVGGGSVSNDNPHSLARIPLRWMIRECFRAKTGIQFEADSLRHFGLNPRTLYPEVLAPTPVDACVSLSTPKRGGKPVGEHGSDYENGASTGTVIDFRVTVAASGDDFGEVPADETPLNLGDNAYELETSMQCVLKRDKRIRTRVDAMPAIDTKILRRKEYDQNVKDIRQPIYDQLELKKWWWILEYLPIRERVQREDGTWKNQWRINRGRPRRVLQNEPLKVHSSVKMRMEGLGYTPRTEFEKEPMWID